MPLTMILLINAISTSPDAW